MTARLAVVDDDPAFTEYLALLLKSRGYEVDIFPSGAALLEALRNGLLPNIVLLDVLMPDIDGLETLRAIRQLHASTQVIMLSGRQTPATIVEAVRLGAADYVLKPGDPEGIGEATLEAAIRNALERESLNEELARLSAQVAEDPQGTQPAWGASAAMQAVTTLVERVADSDVGVLLRGESGVGKEVIARELHRRSSRRGKPFVKVNCAALPADLLESELFGHERGAFTGAGTTRIGKFEFAHLGTILLDEVGEMPAALQAKLLHVLQDKTFTRVGSNRPIEVDVRVLAATNRDLEQMLRDGTFREDLYYRLQVIEIRIPPLRERRDEIPALVEFFIAKYAGVYRRRPVRPSPRLLQALVDFSWPGNVRQLENMMKRFVVLQDESLIMAELAHLRSAASTIPASTTSDSLAARPSAAMASVSTPAETAGQAGLGASGAVPTAPEGTHASAAGAANGGPAAMAAAALAKADDEGIQLAAVARAAAMEAERAAIQDALARFRWNRRKAAAFLNVSYKTLLNKMRECGISDSGAT